MHPSIQLTPVQSFNNIAMAQPTLGEEGMGPLEKGRHRYSKKDYPGALSAFTDVGLHQPGTSHLAHESYCISDSMLVLQVINISTSHILLTALDHRAATYEKLKQLQPALRDAKRMIDLMPETPKVSFTFDISENVTLIK